MVEVKIHHWTPNEVMEIVRELRQQGYVQGVDFDFAYNRATYSTDGWEMIEPKHTVFKFYNDKYATLFAIKYSS